MDKNRDFDLIVTIVTRGTADVAVEAAKRAGAHGGTVLYGRGTGIHETETFFGIAIQPEKEIILNLVRHDLTREIMHGIIEGAGLNTPGRGISFALPVEDVAGISHAIGEVCHIDYGKEPK